MVDQKAPKRKYELKRRAAEMAETRTRIAAAAAELHGTIGPARTTVSAVAERAGVQRHTVYRHFPDDAALFDACSAHYMEAHPLPDPAPWRAIGDPDRRLARALDEIYAYYEQTEPMFSNVMRDLDLVEALRPTVAPLRAFLAEAVDILAAGRPARGRRERVRDAALAHAVAFPTWRSLTAAGRITRAEAVRLAAAMVDAAAAARRTRARGRRPFPRSHPPRPRRARGRARPRGGRRRRRRPAAAGGGHQSRALDRLERPPLRPARQPVLARPARGGTDSPPRRAAPRRASCRPRDRHHQPGRRGPRPPPTSSRPTSCAPAASAWPPWWRAAASAPWSHPGHGRLPHRLRPSPVPRWACRTSPWPAPPCGWCPTRAGSRPDGVDEIAALLRQAWQAGSAGGAD